MNMPVERQIQDLLMMIKPWFDAEQSFFVDLARHDWNARIIVAQTLMNSDFVKEAELLLQSIADSNPDEPERRQARIRALIELAHIKMETMDYDQAEDLLWEARNGFSSNPLDGYFKEDITLLIAQCRFGQGFVQDAIDRAEEVLRKLQSGNRQGNPLIRTHQQLAWYYLHRGDVPIAMAHIKKAMELAPNLAQEDVDEGLKAERAGDFQKAVEHYYDSILPDS